MLLALTIHYVASRGVQTTCTSDTAIANVEKLLTDFRVKGPFELQGYQFEGADGRPTPPHVCVSTPNGDVYEAWTNDQGEPTSIYRGYQNYSQLDLESQPSVAPDAPEALALADLYMAPLHKLGELDVPRLSQNDKNEVTIIVDRLRRGRRIYGSGPEYWVCFQPFCDRLISFQAFGSDRIPPMDFPQFKAEDLVPTAQEELVNGVVPTSSNGWHSVDHGQLTGRTSLGYFAGPGGTSLVWAFEYMLHEKKRPVPSGGIEMTGGPVFSLVGDILIDALSGKVVGTAPYEGLHNAEMKKVGGYFVGEGGWTNGSLTDQPSDVMVNLKEKGHSADDAVLAVKKQLNNLMRGTRFELLEVYLRHRADGKGLEWAVLLKGRPGPGCGAKVDPFTLRVSEVRCF